MYKTRLCLGLGGFDMEPEDQIRFFKKVGFDGFFSGWNKSIENYRRIADEIGMEYQSIHAPFNHAAMMWGDDEAAKLATDELLDCVTDAAKLDVPIVVVHPYIGFGTTEQPSECGLKNFGDVVKRAEDLGVKIAFENVEGERFLAALMERFKDSKNVGFCWDSGHELCYNRGKDMLALYGDRLIATHINDNLGVSKYDGSIFWTDDLHLLPFDGIHDWKEVAARLKKTGFDGMLTFELSKTSKPGRYENDKYKAMSPESYIAEVYARACRLAYMMNGMDN